MIRHKNWTTPMSTAYPALRARRVVSAARSTICRFIRLDVRYDCGMCLICVELAKDAMTATEARRALGEMRAKLDAEHLAEVEAKLAEVERLAKQRP